MLYNKTATMPPTKGVAKVISPKSWDLSFSSRPTLFSEESTFFPESPFMLRTAPSMIAQNTFLIFNAFLNIKNRTIHSFQHTNNIQTSSKSMEEAMEEGKELLRKIKEKEKKKK